MYLISVWYVLNQFYICLFSFLRWLVPDEYLKKGTWTWVILRGGVYEGMNYLTGWDVHENVLENNIMPVGKGSWKKPLNIMGLERDPNYPGFRRISIEYLHKTNSGFGDWYKRFSKHDNYRYRIFFNRNLTNEQLDAFTSEKQDRTDIHNRTILSFMKSRGSFAWAELPGNFTFFKQYVNDQRNLDRVPWIQFESFARTTQAMMIQLFSKANLSPNFPNYPSEVNKLLVSKGLDITDFRNDDQIKKELLDKLLNADRTQERETLMGLTQFPVIAGLTAIWSMINIYLKQKLKIHESWTGYYSPVTMIDQRFCYRPITTLKHMSR